ncbi:NAD(P)-dependent alcohol dehydrogenase [Nocardioides sp.]|uniref:NAD(P)-dependent alcohol dehydrogenase n=1 Tax=Nocardioides sp. TaxID=35761 RepID=UPI00263510A5|nr:NAD(P)-dependent alcohol dehydrogenase [Nocardioides sp.]MCW2737939.1 NAD(P)-dependent alcohol dehydrogenase [Nocardioides sp.]
MSSHIPATETATMLAITQARYGGSDVMRLGQVPRPVVRDGQVLIRVRAAGLDRGTEHLMTGKPYAVRLATGLRRPKNAVPGRDVAGTVAAVGAGVTRFVPGVEVYGVAPSAFAEYAVAGEEKLALMPAGLSFAQASVVPISAGTALQALTVARVSPGQSVLVTGASGGVGGYAVQLAVSLGAEVTGVCSRAKTDHVTAMGAHHVLDYTRDDWADGTRRYDLVLDVAGNPSARR